MEQHNKKAKNNKLSVGEIVIIALLLLATVGQALLWFSISVVRAQEYRRVYDWLITTTATVTKHESYWDPGDDDEPGETRYCSYVTYTVTRHEVDENDDDTDYLSYISYTVNGVRYADIRYENKNKNAELTPIGQKVTVEVSPEDPAVLVEELLNTRFSTEFSTIMIAFAAAAGWQIWMRRKRSKNLPGAPEQEQIERDLRLTVYGRMSLSSWLILAILTSALWWRYPLFIEGWIKYVAVGSIVIWLISLVFAIRCLWSIRNQDYRVTRDILVKKTRSYDSEDGYTYTLTYRSDNGTSWDKNTTERIYTIINEGSGVIAVYMPGNQKPLLHYDPWGNAE